MVSDFTLRDRHVQLHFAFFSWNQLVLETISWNLGPIGTIG